MSSHVRRKHTKAYIRESKSSVTLPHSIANQPAANDIDEDVGDCGTVGLASDVDVVDIGGAGGDSMLGGDDSMSAYDKSWVYESDAVTTLLYEGSTSTVLQALVKHFHWFSDHPGISKEALSSMLAMEHSLLPPGNNLPCTEASARLLCHDVRIQV